jgi:hypothetical protein
MGTAIVAWGALGVGILALWLALTAWVVGRGRAQRVRERLAQVEAALATLDGERANADRVRDHVQQRTRVWTARPGGSRSN